MHQVIRMPATQYLRAQAFTTRRGCGCNGIHDIPRELSAHRGSGIASDQMDSKVSRVARGVAGEERGEGGPLSAEWLEEGGRDVGGGRHSSSDG